MTYHDKLLEAFEGEIIGYAFFSALAQGTEAADEKRRVSARQQRGEHEYAHHEPQQRLHSCSRRQIQTRNTS